MKTFSSVSLSLAKLLLGGEATQEGDGGSSHAQELARGDAGHTDSGDIRSDTLSPEPTDIRNSTCVECASPRFRVSHGHLASENTLRQFVSVDAGSRNNKKRPRT